MQYHLVHAHHAQKRSKDSIICYERIILKCGKSQVVFGAEAADGRQFHMDERDRYMRDGTTFTPSFAYIQNTSNITSVKYCGTIIILALICRRTGALENMWGQRGSCGMAETLWNSTEPELCVVLWHL